MSYNPEAMYDILYGHKSKSDEPPGFKTFKTIASDMLSTADDAGSSVVRQTAVFSNKHLPSMYMQYTFFAINENRRTWPSMSPQLTAALMIGRWIMARSAKLPNYANGLVIPSAELEKDVDRALAELAKWCANDMKKSLAIGYARALRAQTPTYARLNPNIPGNMAIVYLKSAFENHVLKYPLTVGNGDSVGRLINFIAM